MPEPTLRAFLRAQLPLAPGVRRLVVGLSGGLDSTVLLHALKNVAPEFSLPLRAVHVHHGLSPNADAWAEQVAELCAGLQLPLAVQRVQVGRGASREGAAREARHAAFASGLGADEALLLAQHGDDQAETFLFRLLRGAGVTGLGAMRGSRLLRRPDAAAVPQWRPFLTLSRSALRDYAEAHRLRWSEDESNQDRRYDRNFLRLEILPRLESRWPAVRDILAATALRLQEADALLQDFAAELAGSCLDAENRCAVPALKQLSRGRQKLLLRYWLGQMGFLLPDEAVLDRVLTEMLTARADAMPRVSWPGCELRRYRGRLYAMLPLPGIPRGWERDWSGETPLALPDGQLLLADGEAAKSGSWTVRYRRGSERFRPAPQRPSRELKNLLQEAGVPPWQRDRLPLVFDGDELIGVAGLDIPGADLRWRFTLRPPPSR